MSQNHKKSDPELESLKKQKDYWINRIFWLGVEIAIIFAIPAGLGVWLIKSLESPSQPVKVLVMVSAFILSWVIVIYRYQQITKQVKNIEDKIAKHKENHQ